MAEEKDAEFFNMPLAKDDEDPYVGAGQEYVNSADVIGKPIIPEDDDKRKYYEDAIQDQRDLTSVVSVYGVADYEKDPETGERLEGVKRMGDKPAEDNSSTDEPPAPKPTDSTSTESSTTESAPAPTPAPAPAPTTPSE